MTREKYALIVVAAGLALVIAAALLIIFSGPKQTPWELTSTLLPGEVQAANMEKAENNGSARQLTEEELAQAVHLINLLEKKDFTEKSKRYANTPAYSLNLVCAGMELKVNAYGGTKVELVFDAQTAKALRSGRWLVENAALAEFILTMSGAATAANEQ